MTRSFFRNGGNYRCKYGQYSESTSRSSRCGLSSHTHATCVTTKRSTIRIKKNRLSQIFGEKYYYMLLQSTKRRVKWNNSLNIVRSRQTRWLINCRIVVKGDLLMAPKRIVEKLNQRVRRSNTSTVRTYRRCWPFACVVTYTVFRTAVSCDDARSVDTCVHALSERGGRILYTIRNGEIIIIIIIKNN